MHDARDRKGCGVTVSSKLGCHALAASAPLSIRESASAASGNPSFAASVYKPIARFVSRTLALPDWQHTFAKHHARGVKQVPRTGTVGKHTASECLAIGSCRSAAILSQFAAVLQRKAAKTQPNE